MAELVFTGKSSLMGLYNSAPWLFDGVIICLFLGLLFRILFEKANIAKEEKDSRKFGGIVGFLMGVSVVGYMQYRNWHLLVDGGPWLFGALILILGAFIWTLVDGYFGEDSRSTTIPIVAALTLFAVWFFLTNVPSYSNQLDFVLGEIGLPRGIYNIIVWGCLLFVIMWALLSLFGISPSGGIFGRGEGSRPGGGGPGILTRGWRWLFGGGPSTGKPGIIRRGLRRLFGKGGDDDGGGPTPPSPDDITKPDRGTDGDVDDAGKELDNAGDELKKIKAVIKKLMEILKKIHGFEKNKKENIDKTKKPEEFYNALVTLIDELEKEIEKFKGTKMLAKMEESSKNIEKAVANNKSWMLGSINNSEKSIKGLISAISKNIKSPEKEKLAEKSEELLKYLETLKAKYDELCDWTEKQLDTALTDDKLKTAEKSMTDLYNELVQIVQLMAAQGKRIQSLDKADDEEKKKTFEEIKENCDDIMGLIVSTTEHLKDVAGADIFGMLEHGIQILDNLLKEFQGKRKPLVEELKKISQEITLLREEYERILKEQTEKKEGALDLRKYAATIEEERQKLIEVIESGKQLLKDLAAWFKRPLSAEELRKLGLPEEEEAAGRAYEIFPKRDPDKESTEDWRANRAEIGKRIRDRMQLLRDEEIIKHQKIKEAEQILNRAVAQINFVIGELGKRTLTEGSIEKQILDDLNEFIRNSTTIKAYLTDFDVFEKKLMESIIENYRLAFLGQEGRSSTKVETILLTHVMKDIEAMEKIVDLLKIEEERLEKEVPVPPPGEKEVPIPPPK